MNLDQPKEPENTVSHEGETTSQENVSMAGKSFFSAVWEFVKDTINIREGVDTQGTIEGIKSNIDFKGYNVWILIASIFIASIGLNVNSVALIIGAMLISPLMGPIMGVGFSFATNDWKTLIRSIKSLGVAVGVSVFISALYFMLSPFGEVQSELIARTKPTLLDVFVAFLGGIAGIVAGSRKEKSNVVPGVAIATALMPPLCTVGYGLASGQWIFALGAFYLFVINSVFIAVSTLLIVRYLKFPLYAYVDASRQKKFQRIMTIVSLVVVIPSAFTFWGAIKENIFKQQADAFIEEYFDLKGTEIINKKVTYKSSGDKKSTLEVYLIGEIISIAQEKQIQHKFSQSKIENAELKIYQSKDKSGEIAGKLSAEVKSGIISELYEKNVQQLNSKDKQIELLEKTVMDLKQKKMPIKSLQREIHALYPEMTDIRYGLVYHSSFEGKSDTSHVFMINWSDKVGKRGKLAQKERLTEWLKVKLKNNKLRIKVVDSWE